MAGRPDYREALRLSGLMATLAPFDPHVAGTPPLGLDVATSDIDVLCHAPDALAFAEAVWAACADAERVTMRQWTGSGRPVIASFFVHGWQFELFGASEPVAEQAGWRHFCVERRLLALGGEGFRAAVMALRVAGAKTEPAFAAVLGLAGDPYAALLGLETQDDAHLAAVLARCGCGA